jgi:hypothetical protein
MSSWVWIALVWVAASPIATALVVWLIRDANRAYPEPIPRGVRPWRAPEDATWRRGSSSAIA